MGPNKPTHVIRLQKEKRKFRIGWSTEAETQGGRKEGQREIGHGGRVPGELCACESRWSHQGDLGVRGWGGLWPR